MSEAIAIIGAGMAGLSCAQRLAAGRHKVRLFDKGRGPGGRMSTRRASTGLGELRWDHGAQYFTARSPEFVAAVTTWQAEGVVAPWQARFVRILADGTHDTDEAASRFVGVPAMNSVIRAMAAPLEVDWGCRIVSVSGTAGRYILHREDGQQTGPFTRVVVAVPAEQVAGLLGDVAPEIAQIADTARSAPCWSVMLAFEAPLDAPFDAAKCETGPIGWMARNSSKPQRGPGETWVLQADADWSRAHIEMQPDGVAEHLLGAFRDIVPAPEPQYQAGHRWRFAKVERPAAGEAELAAASRGILACGDWARAARVEAAWLSGQSAARRLIEGL